MRKTTIISLIITISAVLCGWGGNNIMAQTKSPIAPKAKDSFRIMSYNVGVIKKFVNEEFTSDDNVKLIAEIIREAEADVVCFQELDSCTSRNRYFQLDVLSKQMGKEWRYNYAPAIPNRGGTYGSGVASKNEPIKCFDILIPTRKGSEDRVVAVMEYEDYVIASTHLNYNQNDQVELINKTMIELYADSDKPVFLGGDMNAQPGSEMMLEFEKHWKLLSTVSERSVQDRMVCIDFVLQFKNKAPIAEVVNAHSILYSNAGDMWKASDHFPIYVDVKLP